MEFDFKHADNIWHFPRKFILSENSKTNSSFLWVRGFSSPDWWLSLSFEAIPHYQSANLCKESSTHNTVKELRSAAADEEKDKCIFKTSCVLLKSKQTPSLWLFWARGGGSCCSVEATWNSGGWRSNQLVCIAMRHCANLRNSTNACYQVLNVTAALLFQNTDDNEVTRGSFHIAKLQYFINEDNLPSLNVITAILIQTTDGNLVLSQSDN